MAVEVGGWVDGWVGFREGLDDWARREGRRYAKGKQTGRGRRCGATARPRPSLCRVVGCCLRAWCTGVLTFVWVCGKEGGRLGRSRGRRHWNHNGCTAAAAAVPVAGGGGGRGGDERGKGGGGGKQERMVGGVGVGGWVHAWKAWLGHRWEVFHPKRPTHFLSFPAHVPTLILSHPPTHTLGKSPLPPQKMPRKKKQQQQKGTRKAPPPPPPPPQY